MPTASDPLGWGDIKSWMDQNQGAFTSWLAQQPTDRQQQLVSWLQADNPLSEVGRMLDDPSTEAPLKSYVSDYLAKLPGEQSQAQVGQLSVGSPAAAEPGATGSAPGASDLTGYLRDLNVEYPNAPEPTPALLAFLKGLGLNLSTAQNIRDTALQRITAATGQASEDITRGAGRSKQNITADLVRRGVLNSGEANTRYARQAEDVAVSQRDLARTKATGESDAQLAYKQSSDAARMQALDRVIGTEQDQATQKASAQATTEAYQRQSDLADQQWQREQAARTDYVNSIKGILSDPANQVAGAFGP